MARLSESPANGAQPQSATKHQVTLKNGALGGFLSSPAKPSGSQSPHPNKRLKSLTATASPRSQASRSVSPAGQRLPSQAPLSSPARKSLADTSDNLDIGDRSTPADSVQAAPVDTPTASTPTSTAPTANMEVVNAASAATPEPVTDRPGVVSSVRKTLTNVVNNFTGARNGSATITSTFEQTIVSRKRSREPEIEETPTPAEETTPTDDQSDEAAEPAGANDTVVELGNQLEADVAAERAKSPEKRTAQLSSEATPATDASEINVTTAVGDADTIEAAESTKPAAPAEDEDEDMADDPVNGQFVLDTILDHRHDPKDNTLFQMRIRWKHDEPSWEPESNIQEDAEEALFEYWKTVKGGRLGAMVDKNLWHVLKVEKHRQKPNGKVELSVAWTGSPDRSWEPEDNIVQVARELVDDYWNSKGGREKCVRAIAVPAKRGRGRPRKVVDEEAPKPAAKPAPKQTKAKAAKEAKEPAPKKTRQPRKKLTDGVEDQNESVPEAAAKDEQPEQAAKEQVEANAEPPKKRGRGRPRKAPAVA
ncbi:chromo domain-containing protein [Colletotrichum karsti]|uniref:Chromo domain-containing protein n=1 Tax=Colletotrichum karsti TaxID=1095194 RepID=A0A9P6HS58_9PEZI|nr:chromo domain-containing protein [Colletotrichum karsti]KAF9869313.1 chromo domain-containing protein [Colletotrichum karsti]